MGQNNPKWTPLWGFAWHDIDVLETVAFDSRSWPIVVVTVPIMQMLYRNFLEIICQRSAIFQTFILNGNFQLNALLHLRLGV
jgi:hypothetical protein